MAKGKLVDLGHRSFPTQKAATTYFQQMLRRHKVGTVLVEGDSDFQDVRALLERHPECDQKVGCGIAAFAVQLDNAGNRGSGKVSGLFCRSRRLLQARSCRAGA
jgi:hypothetical protein